MAIRFSGEFMVPGQVSERIEADHRERYRFASQFAPGKRVLDIACGVGYGTKMMRDAGAAEAWGVDISPDVIQHAREHYAGPGINFAQASICTFGDVPPFDLIVCFETIEHVPDHEAALENLHRLLKGGGQLIISTPNRPITSPRARRLGDKPSNPYHEREFTLGEFRSLLLDHGFNVGDEGVFGQRQRRDVHFAWLKFLRRWLDDPDRTSSAQVEPVRRLAPRYIVVVATKAHSVESRAADGGGASGK